MNKQILNTFLICFLLVTIDSVNPWSDLVIGNTTFWWIIFVVMLVMVSLLKKSYININYNKIIWPIKLYIFWNVVAIIRGIFVAENYWEWKGLMDRTMFFILPILVYISTNKFLVQKMVSLWLKYALPAFFIFLPFFSQSDAAGGYLIPIMFLLLFFPALPSKWKVIVLFFTFMVFIAGLDARSSIIKYSVSFILGISFYLQRFIKTWMFKFAQAILIVLPLILLGLGLTGVFNVFKMDEYINTDEEIIITKEGQDDIELTADTRTFLYVEVINSAIKNDYIFLGRTPARGYDSEYFGDYMAEDLGTGKRERFASEVSILNIFTWTGLVGVLCYSLIFFQASVLAIYKSNNFFIKIVGIFVAFRWVYAFVEDFTNFDLSYIFLLMLIGMCYSKEFRAMNNSEFIVWVNGIVSKKYSISTQKKNKSGISNSLVQ